MIAFVDTSVLAKRYLSEVGSDRARALFRGHRPIAVSRLAFAELSAAVARACREGLITTPQRDVVIKRLPGDFNEWIVVEPRRAVIERAAELVLTHPLRAYDALQLASCQTLSARGGAVELWSADLGLSEAGRREGFKVVPFR